MLFIANSVGAQSQQDPTGFMEDAILAEDELSILLQEEPLSRFKKQALQRLAVSSGYFTDRDNTSEHRWFATEIGTGIPLGNFENILATEISFRNDVLSLPDEGLKRSDLYNLCLLYTSPSPRDVEESRMPSSA